MWQQIAHSGKEFIVEAQDRPKTGEADALPAKGTNSETH